MCTDQQCQSTESDVMHNCNKYPTTITSNAGRYLDPVSQVLLQFSKADVHGIQTSHKTRLFTCQQRHMADQQVKLFSHSLTNNNNRAAKTMTS